VRELRVRAKDLRANSRVRTAKVSQNLRTPKTLETHRGSFGEENFDTEMVLNRGVSDGA
jgi:hypothetical protein